MYLIWHWVGLYFIFGAIVLIALTMRDYNNDPEGFFSICIEHEGALVSCWTECFLKLFLSCVVLIFWPFIFGKEVWQCLKITTK
jgi:hypothetical protein